MHLIITFEKDETSFSVLKLEKIWYVNIDAKQNLLTEVMTFFENLILRVKI